MERISVKRTATGIMISISTKEGFVITYIIKEEAAMELHKQLEHELYSNAAHEVSE